MLGEFEQLVLLAVVRVEDDAYGVTVRQEIMRRTRRDVTLGAVYTTLTRLEAKGLLESASAEPTAERGGRRKRVFTLTAAGRRELRAAMRALSAMAHGLDVGLEAR